MQSRFIIGIVGIIVFALLFILVPVKKIKVSKMTGKNVLPLSNAGILKTIITLVVAAVLIVVTMFRNFAPWIQVILCGCGILAEYMSIIDLANYGKNGIYENGILYGGKFFEFTDIKAFPVLQLPAEEQENYAKNTLVITTGKRGKEAVIFADDEECALVTAKIFELHPELKNW